ncbi:ketopantoate reductase family protein [Arthrobacter sp. zg-Y1171]|uniref:ketopantoate reductase family protein n=1 Tax=Arthrobacter sp. zg-Y1171 TaxID=2964610 RepID=UPI0021068763|nr:2-dehydropantoate 2-reductase [Arthrobacter sp. zg-Y1171]MCQ1995762.1 2-dehydropantoate 2-reductase [Arthrobacter sp. zg-Y1171]UWX83157.1 2-dehydropantoate 2-reductase [Arthrobacter sp. zg-Y1171]
MKIGIVGAGGVGAYFAAALSRAGHDVHLLVTPRHVDPLSDHGIHLTSGDGRDEFIALAGVSTDAAAIGVCDAVVLGCKAGQVRDVMQTALPLLGPDTPVLPLQNGVTASEQITAAVGGGHALGGLCMIISYLVEPGHVHHVGGNPAVTLGELDGTPTARVQALAAALISAGISTRISDDITTELWRKFMLIASYGGVGALCRKNVGETRTHPGTRALVEDAMREVATIAAAVGVNLTEDDVKTTMAQYDAFTPDSTASMQRDLIAGRPSELEEQNGALARIAAKHNTPAPIHTTIYRALSILDRPS